MRIIRIKIIFLKVAGARSKPFQRGQTPLCQLVEKSELKNKTKPDYIPKRTKELWKSKNARK